jgi:transcriptional regulator with XRE-family HTH domain
MHLEITDPTKIQRYRVMQGLSIAEAAELSGIPEARWRNFETGFTPTIHAPFLKVMAELLEIPQTVISAEAPDEDEVPVYEYVNAGYVSRYLHRTGQDNYHGINRFAKEARVHPSVVRKLLRTGRCSLEDAYWMAKVMEIDPAAMSPMLAGGPELGEPSDQPGFEQPMVEGGISAGDERPPEIQG